MTRPISLRRITLVLGLKRNVPGFITPARLFKRHHADKSDRDWIDTTIFDWNETGQNQSLSDQIQMNFGVVPGDSPPIPRELLLVR